MLEKKNFCPHANVHPGICGDWNRWQTTLCPLKPWTLLQQMRAVLHVLMNARHQEPSRVLFASVNDGCRLQRGDLRRRQPSTLAQRFRASWVVSRVRGFFFYWSWECHLSLQMDGVINVLLQAPHCRELARAQRSGVLLSVCGFRFFGSVEMLQVLQGSTYNSKKTRDFFLLT